MISGVKTQPGYRSDTIAKAGTETVVVDHGSPTVIGSDATMNPQRDCIECKTCNKVDQIKASDSGYMVLLVCNRCFQPGGVVGFGPNYKTAVSDWKTKNQT